MARKAPIFGRPLTLVNRLLELVHHRSDYSRRQWGRLVGAIIADLAPEKIDLTAFATRLPEWAVNAIKSERLYLHQVATGLRPARVHRTA